MQSQPKDNLKPIQPYSCVSDFVIQNTDSIYNQVSKELLSTQDKTAFIYHSRTPKFQHEDGDDELKEIGDKPNADDEKGKQGDNVCNDTWCQWAYRQNDNVIELLVLETFRNMVEVATIHPVDTQCLKWLTQLYLGKFPQHDQINFLPFPVTIPFNENRNKNIVSLWYHLWALTDTLSGMKELYWSGNVHLLSREESQRYLQTNHQYLLRLSNFELGKLILSTNRFHMYLEVSPDAKVVKRYGMRELILCQWNFQTLKDKLRVLSASHDFHIPVLGAIPISEITTTYLSHHQQEFQKRQQGGMKLIV